MPRMDRRGMPKARSRTVGARRRAEIPAFTWRLKRDAIDLRASSTSELQPMDLGLSGKRALVLSSSRGLGLGVAESLAREGAHVMMTARSGDRLEAAAS